MLDFAHDDRIFPRRAPQKAGRFSLAKEEPAADPRDARVLAIKARVTAGEYLTDAKLDAALERMLDDVLG